MKDIPALIDCLAQSPLILRNLLKQIDPPLYRIQRRPEKWSIHENACHLAQAERMIKGRFGRFQSEQRPNFEVYLPGRTVSDNLIDLDLEEQLNHFEELRSATIQLLRSFDEKTWEKQADHLEYSQYGSYILLRHTLMHDHFHMYRIEELGFTRDGYL